MRFVNAAGDIIEIPYQEGICQRCRWTVTRDNIGEPWHGQLGGDCRARDDGEHYVTGSEWLTRRARIAEGEITTITLTSADGKILLRQEVQKDCDFRFSMPAGDTMPVAAVSLSRRKYLYHAALREGE